ncbi:hypothetical protein A9Q99_12380 [Gammaproteobacteria bacterium 45_16_T64]|nr:hypothetical protein A9Q99_12380 [Gammaproteobacteria bacterium 45_16_T64]
MSESSPHSVPSWIWLFTGVATGLFLAFLYYLAGIQTPTQQQDKQPQAVTAPSQPSERQQAPAYDFYNLLPEVKVTPPSRKQKEVVAKTAVSQAKPSILLQTGAFTLPTDADRRRAELLLLGLNVNVAPVHVKGKTYHRVQVGPFSTKQSLDDAKNLLSQNGIEHLERKLPLKN